MASAGLPGRTRICQAMAVRQRPQGRRAAVHPHRLVGGPEHRESRSCDRRSRDPDLVQRDDRPRSRERRVRMTTPIHIITPVWGTAHTRCFLDVGLPSLLAPGNLAALDRQEDHLLHVLTTERDRETFEDSPAWRHARATFNCRLDLIGPDLMNADPHLTMSNCHRQAILHADARAAAMMFYNPDIVLADGGMLALAHMLERGKRAIQVVGLRLVKHKVVPLLTGRHASADGLSIVISPRELMAIAMKHLHPLSMMHLHDADDIDIMPQAVFWRVAEEGLVARCFHIHPILVHPRVRNAPFSTTVDDDYLRAACPDPADEYVVADSDEFCLCELSGIQRGVVGLPRTGNDIDIARWAWTSARPHHFEHLCRRIMLHTNGTTGPEWQAVAARSDAVVRDILEHLVEFEDEARRRAPQAG